MRVAAVQLAAGPDKAANRRLVSRLVEQAAAMRPDLVIAPEASMRDLGPAGTDIAADAESVDGPFVEMLAAAARLAGCVVIAGMFEPAPSGLVHNTLVAVGSDGAILATYRKVHLYDSFGYQESDRVAAGAPTGVTFDVAGIRVGLMTCYDLRFPEQARALVDAGADLLAVPAAWVRGPLKETHWSTLLRARAIENTVYVVGAAQCGPVYCGSSAIVDPMGVSVATLAESPGVAVAEIDPDRLADVRQTNPALTHRRWRVVPG